MHTFSGAAHSKHTYGNLFHRNHHHSPQRHHNDVWTGCTGVWWRTSTCCACSWVEGSLAHHCHHNSLAPRHTRAVEAHSACRHTGSIWAGRCDCLRAQQSKVSTHNNDRMKCSHPPPHPHVIACVHKNQRFQCTIMNKQITHTLSFPSFSSGPLSFPPFLSSLSLSTSLSLSPFLPLLLSSLSPSPSFLSSLSHSTPLSLSHPSSSLSCSPPLSLPLFSPSLPPHSLSPSPSLPPPTLPPPSALPPPLSLPPPPIPLSLQHSLQASMAQKWRHWPQKSPSSDPSPQSLSVSHLRKRLMHSPLLHLNSRLLHVLSAETIPTFACPSFSLSKFLCFQFLSMTIQSLWNSLKFELLWMLAFHPRWNCQSVNNTNNFFKILYILLYNTWNTTVMRDPETMKADEMLTVEALVALTNTMSTHALKKNILSSLIFYFPPGCL